MSEIPTIEMVMTAEPKTLDFERPAHEARKLMDELNIRHLPITRGNRPIGILSERELRLTENLEEKLGQTITVGELCELDPYTVTPDTPLDTILHDMASRGIGSALVVQSGELLGIYTTVDACSGFCDLLRSLRIRE